MAGFVSGVLVLLQLLYTFIYPFIKCLIGIFKRKKRPDYSRDIVLITGAAQGIGKQIALQVNICVIIDYCVLLILCVI